MCLGTVNILAFTRHVELYVLYVVALAKPPAFFASGLPRWGERAQLRIIGNCNAVVTLQGEKKRRRGGGEGEGEGEGVVDGKCGVLEHAAPGVEYIITQVINMPYPAVCQESGCI